MELEEQEFYMEQLMDNYKNPQNRGKLEDFTFFRHQKNQSCGDSFEIYVKIKDNKIIDMKYTGQGCAISTASMSLLSQKLIGMDYEESKKLSDLEIFEILGIKISPGRINCALLSLNAYLNAIKDYENKNA